MYYSYHFRFERAMYNMTEEIKAVDQNRVIFIPVLVVGIAANAGIVFKIVKKQWNSLLPIHVYQITFFSGLFLLTLTGSLTAFFMEEDTFICSLSLFISFFARINFVVDIFLLQIDRLLAISKPLYHHAEVTATISWKIVLAAKLSTLLLVTLASLIEPNLVHYQPCHRCIFVHPVNVFLHSIPSIAAFLLTLIVSIFASTKVLNENKIGPTVNLGPNLMNRTEQQQRNLEEQNQISYEQENKAELFKILKEINSQLESTSFYNKGIKRMPSKALSSL